MISTIGYNQHDMIKDIISLYCPDGIDCDLTYSKGNFYKNGIRAPHYKFDISPQSEDVMQGDSRNIALDDCSIKTIMFDPPFVGASRKDGKPGIIKARFGYFKNIPELWDYYNQSIKECYRVLAPGGVLVFKCQDSVESHKQWITHVEVMNQAVRAGFYPKDLFVLLAKSRLISPNMKNQKHARKYHCYFWVFKKEDCKVNYTI